MTQPGSELNRLMSEFISDIAAKYMVEPVKEQLAQILLEDRALMVDSADKFEALLKYSDSGVASKSNPFDVDKAVIRLGVNLPVDQRTRLEVVNDDVKLVFPTVGPTMPHALAYVQRMIDTERLFNLVSLADGPIIDIGGNYYAHAKRARNVVCHSCTKKGGIQEAARQKYRQVMMQTESLQADFCVDGAECCDFKARNSISIHAITDIDPQFWPEIFARHDLQSHIAVFHFDYDIVDNDVGYIADANMHWYKNGDQIVFYFENDSSNSYTQNLSWLLRYSTPWHITRPQDDFVLFYQVDFVAGGRAQATITRLQKDTILVSNSKPAYRYTNREEVITVTAPRFSELPGADIKNPHDYIMDQVDVPVAFYEFVQKRAYSNYTQNPNEPLSITDVRRLTRTYDFTRNLSGTNITRRANVSPELLERIGMGVYLIVRRQMAVDRVVTGEAIKGLSRLKKSWGDYNWWKALGTGLLYVNLLPLFVIYQSFNDQVAILAEHMRAVVASNYISPVDPKQVLVQRILPVERIGVDGELRPFVPDMYDDQKLEKFHDEVSPDIFYEYAGDILTPDQNAKLQAYLDLRKPKGDPPPLNTLEAADFIGSTPTTEDEVVTREGWLRDYKSYHDSVMNSGEDTHPIWTPETTSAEREDSVKAKEFFSLRIQEYGLYCADLGISAMRSAQDYARATWNGKQPDSDQIRKLNIQYDAGIRYVSVNDLQLNMTDDDAAAAVIDPYQMELLLVKRTPKGYFVNKHSGRCLFTCTSLEIFNYFNIAKNAHRMASVSSEKDVKVETYLHDGVPGCGKTHQILQAFTMDDVVVVSTKATQLEILSSLRADKRFKGLGKALELRVRTLDSAAIRGLPKAKKLYVDEAILSHSGAICMAMFSSGCSEAHMFGDSFQIEMIDRSSKTGALRFGGFYYFTKVYEYNVTYRCPADATFLMRTFYPESRRSSIVTMSPVLRSMELLVVDGPDDSRLKLSSVPYYYMTVMRADKGVLLATSRFIDAKKEYSEFGDKRPVGTVHESQGLTKAFVAAVRTNVFNATVFDRASHMNVMFSRHTHRFVYKTPVSVANDAAAAAVFRLSQISDDDLRSVMIVPEPWMALRFSKIADKYGKYL